MDRALHEFQLNALKFTMCSPPGLQRDHQRNRFRFDGFIEPHSLGNPVILDDEIFGGQPVRYLSCGVLYESGYEHDIRLASDVYSALRSSTSAAHTSKITTILTLNSNTRGAPTFAFVRLLGWGQAPPAAT